MMGLHKLGLAVTLSLQHKIAAPSSEENESYKLT